MRTKQPVVGILASALAIASVTAVLAADWPSFRGPSHDGKSAETITWPAELTNRPGVCFVTRGPGATNAAHGVHVAQHDGTPMILFIGQVERAMLGRGAARDACSGRRGENKAPVATAQATEGANRREGFAMRLATVRNSAESAALPAAE